MFQDLISNCPGKSENLQPQGLLRVFPSSNFFSEAAPKFILEISFYKILRNSMLSTRGQFLLYLGNFEEIISLIVVPKISHRTITKTLLLKKPQYLQENTCVGVSF